ncbi:MAG: HNH endonuclease [Bdellovibrionales bacterium]|nr:HNH endonuclease [Bdellovibrionales bacterium]
MDFCFTPVDSIQIKIERNKARQLRQSLWWRQQLGKGFCHYCKGKFGKEELTMDHVQPLVLGGKTSKKNVVVSCKPCNTSKGYNLTRS